MATKHVSFLTLYSLIWTHKSCLLPLYLVTCLLYMLSGVITYIIQIHHDTSGPKAPRPGLISHSTAKCPHSNFKPVPILLTNPGQKGSNHASQDQQSSMHHRTTHPPEHTGRGPSVLSGDPRKRRRFGQRSRNQATDMGNRHTRGLIGAKTVHSGWQFGHGDITVVRV